MLSRVHRLPSPDVALILRSGKRIRIDGLDVRYRASDTVSRFAFVVSSKIDKRATARNRMRRLLSEAVRLLLPSVQRSFDMVIIVRSPLPDTYMEVKKKIQALFDSVAG